LAKNHKFIPADSNPLLAPLLHRLHHSGRLRVWSIVVSIFGELVQSRQQTISVQELLALTSHVGIEENALRTALSRLAKEGWVERHKEGRLAFYALSDSGRKTFLAASARIYSPDFESPSTHWNLAYFKDASSKDAIDPSIAFSLSRHWLLLNNEDKASINGNDVIFFPTEPMQMPTWAIQNFLQKNLGVRYAELLEDLQPLLDESSLVNKLSPLSGLAARYLIVHAWRRLVLRHPLLPQQLLEDDWPGYGCHRAICNLYPKLVQISEQWWQSATPKTGQLMLEKRFSKS